MKTIYLVVLYDRHTDDSYMACRNLEFAKRAADKLMGSYEDRYHWHLEDVSADGWHYRHITELEDGPRIHIEEIDLV